MSVLIYLGAIHKVCMHKIGTLYMEIGNFIYGVGFWFYPLLLSSVYILYRCPLIQYILTLPIARNIQYKKWGTVCCIFTSSPKVGCVPQNFTRNKNTTRCNIFIFTWKLFDNPHTHL